jgi:hypothetical protein
LQVAPPAGLRRVCLTAGCLRDAAPHDLLIPSRAAVLCMPCQYRRNYTEALRDQGGRQTHPQFPTQTYHAWRGLTVYPLKREDFERDQPELRASMMAGLSSGALVEEAGLLYLSGDAEGSLLKDPLRGPCCSHALVQGVGPRRFAPCTRMARLLSPGFHHPHHQQSGLSNASRCWPPPRRSGPLQPGHAGGHSTRPQACTASMPRGPLLTLN